MIRTTHAVSMESQCSRQCLDLISSLETPLNKGYSFINVITTCPGHCHLHQDENAFINKFSSFTRSIMIGEGWRRKVSSDHRLIFDNKYSVQIYMEWRKQWKSLCRRINLNLSEHPTLTTSKLRRQMMVWVGINTNKDVGTRHLYCV